MNPVDIQEDPLLAALRELRTLDVSPARAKWLRVRCHRALRLPTTRHDRTERLDARVSATLRVLVGAWCGVYVWEIIRRAAAVYGF